MTIAYAGRSNLLAAPNSTAAEPKADASAEAGNATANATEENANATAANVSANATEEPGVVSDIKCVTKSDSRINAWLTETAPEGTPCLFGVDVRDEGSHCIFDNGQFGSNGFCFTKPDGSQWGSCNSECPLYGPALTLGNKIEKVANAVNRIDAKLGSKDADKGNNAEGESKEAKGNNAEGESKEAKGNNAEGQSKEALSQVPGRVSLLVHPSKDHHHHHRHDHAHSDRHRHHHAEQHGEHHHDHHRAHVSAHGKTSAIATGQGKKAGVVKIELHSELQIANTKAA